MVRELQIFCGGFHFLMSLLQFKFNSYKGAQKLPHKLKT